MDTVADNASSGGLVHGPWTPVGEAPDLTCVTVRLVRTAALGLSRVLRGGG
ncbi:hypothetical protein ACWGI9_04690 [Streptomyces sp. NPDC054833]